MMEMNKKTQFNIWYWIAAFFILMAFQYLFTAATQVAQIPYSQFETYLGQGRIAEVAVSDRFIQGRFKEPVEGRPMFITTRVEPDLARQLQERGVVFTGQIESTLLRDLLSWVVPVVLFVGIWMYMLRRVGGGIGGGLMQIGKSKAKVYVQSDTGVTFADVAGVDEAKDELKEIVDFLKDPQGYGRLGGRMPKGILLVGPPGTPARPAYRSSPSRARSSWRCSSAWAPLGFATFSSKRGPRLPPSSSSMNSMRSAVPAASAR
jgi:cell division protease FtsH